ncbi:MAG: hypothetical protein AABX37_00715, partial [Nanoarchaeota archaeon]
MAFISPEVPKSSVLAETDIDPQLVLNINVPSSFNKTAEFLQGLESVEIATLSGGITTENENINAGTGTLTASNILYGVTAGTGITISAGQTPTVTNSDLGSSQSIFKNIKVGSTSFSTGSNTDTLELAAGSNITLSADTSNKKVTIAGSSPTSAGWTDDGTTVRLTTSTDSVGIGTTSPDTKLHIAGTFKVTGATTLNGVAYTWPSADGSSDYILRTNGSGSLTWIAPGGNVNYWQRNSGALSPFSITDDLLLGATSTTSANFAFINNAGGTPTASVSGNLVLAGARSIQTTANNTLTIGGSTTGNITISPLNGASGGILNFDTTNLQIAGTAGATIGSAACVLTTDGIVTSSATCPAGEVTVHWDSLNGALVPKITTHDLLLGGTATTSAKFGFLNVNSGTPTASVSANSGNNAAYLTGLGNLATTNAQTLTLGGSTTGNISVDSGSSAISILDQCVTGDTLLRRRRKRKSKVNPRLNRGQKSKVEGDWEDVRIDQIREGDEILSMEPDGTFDWRKV